MLEPRSCFGSRISRSGAASPLGSYCAASGAACSSNADCGAGKACEDDTASPRQAALFCMPATSSSVINNVAGISGPGALELRGRLTVHRGGSPD